MWFGRGFFHDFLADGIIDPRVVHTAVIGFVAGTEKGEKEGHNQECLFHHKAVLFRKDNFFLRI